MKTSCYLIVGANGAIRINKRTYSLNWDEVAIALTLDIPDRLFERPMLSATITLPESSIADVQGPIVLSAQHVADVLGIDVTDVIDGFKTD